MNIRKRVSDVLRKAAQYLSPVWMYGSGSWRSVHETTTGTWQQDVVVDLDTVSRNWAVFSCASLISGDIAKMPARVEQYDADKDIWVAAKHWPLLQKPNRYQTWVEFSQNWDFSQLFNGNTYVLKERDRTGEIVALYILDPCRVEALISEDAGIYYRLSDDNLAGIESQIVVPASEIIHDRYKTPWHPLIGVSPIYACGMAAMQGAAIVDNSSQFFANMSRPGGLLTAPGAISATDAAAIKTAWNTNYTGDNAGKVAVLGDGMKYESMIINATDSQMLEQLKFSGEMVCACFHVPPYKLGLGAMPTVNNTGVLNQQYFDQAIHYLVKKKEDRLTEGLELRQPNFRIALDEDALLRMDPVARYDSQIARVKGGVLMPNEARRFENLPPVPGGDVCYLQQQNFSLAALDKRDQKDDPFGSATPTPTPQAPPSDDEQRQWQFKSLGVLRAELGMAA